MHRRASCAVRHACLASIIVAAWSAMPAHARAAQNAAPADAASEAQPANDSEIIVSARRRDERLTGTSLSGFGELTANLSDQLELAAGARWSGESRNSFQESLPAHLGFATAFPGGLRLDDRYREDDFSPQATLRFKPNRDLTFYAAYKEGFKSGGFNISQTLTAAATVAAGQYNAERARGGEIGARAILLDSALSLNATGYLYDYIDLQV